MEGIDKAIEWIGEKVKILGKSNAHLENAGNLTPKCRRSVESHTQRTSPEVDGNSVNTKSHSEGFIRGKNDIDDKDKGVSPFDFKTLVVIQDLPGTKIAEIKPNPLGPISPPVATGMVTSSTTRLNELSPPCPGETESVCQPKDIFNQRRLKEKSESFTGIGNFAQRKPKFLKRANSDRLMNVPECNTGFLPAPTDVRRVISDSKALQSGNELTTFAMPEKRFSMSKSIDFQSKHSLASRDEETENSQFQNEANALTADVKTISPSSLSISTEEEKHIPSTHRHEAIRPPHSPCSPVLQRLNSRSSVKSARLSKRRSTPNLRDIKSASRMSNNVRVNRSSWSQMISKTENTVQKSSLKRICKNSFKEKTRPDESRLDKSVETRASANKIGTIDTCTSDKKANEIAKQRNILLQMQMTFNGHQMRRTQLELYRNGISVGQTTQNARGTIQFSMQFYPSCMFRVTLIKAKGIRKSPKTTSLFAKVSLKPGNYKKYTSKKVAFSENPEFLEDFDFRDIDINDLLDMHLKISIFKKDGMLSLPKLVGETFSSMINYDICCGKTIWKTLRVPTKRKSSIIMDDLDRGFDTQYPNCMADTACLLNQCFKHHNSNTSRMIRRMSAPTRGTNGNLMK